MKLDRRSLLISGGAGVGLIVAFHFWPRHIRSKLAVLPGEQAFGSFIKIARDGRVTVAVPQVETGQGIWTGLPQVVADELGAAWETMSVEPAPLRPVYANALASEEEWPAPIRITACSTSVRAFERPMREASAIARSMLIGAAADRWGVDPSSCDTADGLVISGVRTLKFGELAEEAAARRVPGNTPLRLAIRSSLRGQTRPRLDGPAKTQGRWRFAADVRLPGLLYASARLAPPGGNLESFSREDVERMPGVRHLSARGGWIAVVADSWWQAEQALKRAQPRFTGKVAPVDMRRQFDEALANVATSKWFSEGNYDEAVSGSRPLAATYYAAPSQHLQLEPLGATARVGEGGVELWTASQAPRLVDSSTSLYPMPAGGPSGRAMEPDSGPIAVELAREVGRPVQLVLSQSASQNLDRVSPGALARMTALPGAGGITAAFAMKVATADGLGAALSRLGKKKLPSKLGRSALEGSIPPYAIPNLRIETISAKLPFAPGYMRGSPQREFAFFIESFIDELAHAAGMEPLSFRMSMLGHNVRLAHCLETAAQLASWDGGGAGSTMGIAGVSAFGSHIGLVASASLGDRQNVVVHKLVAAVDCGRAINRSLIEQQIEGGLIWAIAQSSVPSPEWIAAMPRARAIGGVGLPRLGEIPEIVIQIVESSEDPGGISGLGTVALAPAVANAVHAASGKRIRTLPFNVEAA